MSVSDMTSKSASWKVTIKNEMVTQTPVEMNPILSIYSRQAIYRCATSIDQAPGVKASLATMTLILFKILVLGTLEVAAFTVPPCWCQAASEEE